MFKKMYLDLGKGYQLIAVRTDIDYLIEITCDNALIGTANLTTDNIDVACITHVNIDDKHVNYPVTDQHTLGDALIKFLIKFPSVVRKAEFRFIMEASDNLKPSIDKYHFDHGTGTNIENEILIRKTECIPAEYKQPANIQFTRGITEDKLPLLLAFLKKNAYWQKNLTLNRLAFLTQHARCFYVFSTSSNEMLGFARVVTNSSTFASLWDVVVDEQHRGHGIGTALMAEIFSDISLSKIPHWVLFTDTAKKLYAKFGFVSESEFPSRKWVHKLRLQETCPNYMEQLIQATSFDQIKKLNPQESLQFLFGHQGKRQRLSVFWKEPREQKEQGQVLTNPHNFSY